MKNVKISQIKLKEEPSDQDKNKKYELYSPQINASKGKISFSNNNPLVDLFAPQSTTNKNYSSNDKVYSLSQFKKNEFVSKTKQSNSIIPNKTNLSVNNSISHHHSNASFHKNVSQSFKETINTDNYNSLPLKKEEDKSINIETMKNYNSEKTPETMSVASFLNGGSNLIPLSINNLKSSFPNYENSKYSVKSMQYIKAYAANTNQGIIRNYNEDRVSIILNILRPNSYTGKDWPKSSFFGIYDGHGGAACADFLRDNLHQYIIKDSNFPSNPSEAIRKGCEQAEKDFLTQHALNKNQEIVDRSGSCAIFALIVEDICYMANIGDSRGIMSTQNGKKIICLTNDHKPNDEKESKRIMDNGGKVYQTQTNAKNFNIANTNVPNNQILLGPHRVFPGRLSVSRTFGDVEAKLSKFGGMSGVIISVPDITHFKINQEMDFILLGCDGIFDQLTNREIADCVWMTMKDNVKAKNIHIQCGLAIDMIIKTSLIRRTLDNVTAVLIAFPNFENTFNGQISLNKIEKNYKSNVPDNKSIESKKVEVNYHSNKENTNFKLKSKFSEEIDKTDKIIKNINTPQNHKGNSVQFSLNSYSSVKKGKDDSNLDMNPNTDKSHHTKLNINLNSEDMYYKSNTIVYSDNKVVRENFPSSTKAKASSFKERENLKK